MSRVLKSGLEYFPHEVDASTDPKLEPVIMRFGAAGYAFYFMHLEYCYRADGFEIDVSADERGRGLRCAIARKLRMTHARYEEILQAFLHCGAFDAEHYHKTGMLTSNGIKRRADTVVSRRQRDAERRRTAREAAEREPEADPARQTPLSEIEDPNAGEDADEILTAGAEKGQRAATTAADAREVGEKVLGVCKSSACTCEEDKGGKPALEQGLASPQKPMSAKTRGAGRGKALLRESTAEHSTAEQSIGKERTLSHVPATEPKKPTGRDEVRSFCRERASPVDPDRFFDYYSARGWNSAGGRIVDWQAALRSWEKTQLPNQAAKTAGGAANPGGGGKNLQSAARARPASAAGGVCARAGGGGERAGAQGAGGIVCKSFEDELGKKILKKFLTGESQKEDKK
jgi:hypothetical protein